MLSLTKSFLKETPKTPLYSKDHIIVTTTDGVRKSYSLQKKQEDRFLSQCGDLLEDGNQLHLNVVLNSLLTHCLLIDADVGGCVSLTSAADSRQEARKLYGHIVHQISQELFNSNEQHDENTTTLLSHLRDSSVLDAYFLVKPNSQNFHLIFPNLYLERHDHCWFLKRLKDRFPYVDNVQGWMIHGCTKTKDGVAYQVVGCFKCNVSHEIYYVTDNEMNVQLKGTYGGKMKLKDIWIHLLYPGMSKLKHQNLIFFGYATMKVGSDYELSSDDECKLLFTYVDNNCEIFKVYSFLRKDVSRYNRDDIYDTDLFEWLKAKQNDFEFRNCDPNITTYIHRFKPVCYTGEDEEEESENTTAGALTKKLVGPAVGRSTAAAGGPTTAAGCSTATAVLETVDDMVQKLELLVQHIGHTFSFAEMEPTIRDYGRYYPSVLKEIFSELELDGSSLNESDDRCTYDLRTLKYEFARAYGVPLNIFQNCLIPKRLLTPLFGIIHNAQIEHFGEFVSSNVLPFVPFTVQENDIRIFNWNARHWKYRTPKNGFFRLLLSSLYDHVLNHTRSEDAKKILRKTRQMFTGEFKTLQTAVCLKHYRPQNFDTNPWLLGLEGGLTYDLVNSICRLTIPQDYISKTARLSMNYQHLPFDFIPFKVFMDRDVYNRALDQLREHLQGGGSMESFSHTTDKKVNLLFAFIATVFCEEFEEMYFFLSFVADCLIGQNFRRWILFLFGDTSNGKTSIARLCQSALGKYAGVLSPEQFYENKSRSAEGASPELVSKLGCRLLVVEEISDRFELNVANLNSLTGNNRRYVRGLYQEGVEYDVSFQMICTLNKPPKMEITAAIKQRLKVLGLHSHFMSEAKKHDFDSRIFPQCQNLKTEELADVFLGLVLHLLRVQRREQNMECTNDIHRISVPKSVDQKLNSLASITTPIAKFSRMYVLTVDHEEFITVEAVKRHLHNFKEKNPLLCVAESKHSLYQQFEAKYESNLAPNGDGFFGLRLEPFQNTKKQKMN